jgi:hypothetical protein
MLAGQSQARVVPATVQVCEPLSFGLRRTKVPLYLALYWRRCPPAFQADVLATVRASPLLRGRFRLLLEAHDMAVFCRAGGDRDVDRLTHLGLRESKLSHTTRAAIIEHLGRGRRYRNAASRAGCLSLDNTDCFPTRRQRPAVIFR